MIKDDLAKDMIQAMKDGEKLKLSVIRMLRSELKNAEIAAGGELDEIQTQKILKSYAKKRRESIEKYREGGREDLAEKETREYDITMSYLPPMMNEKEIEFIINEAIIEMGAAGRKDFGKIMKAVMEKTGGRAEGSEISVLLKKALSDKST